MTATKASSAKVSRPAGKTTKRVKVPYSQMEPEALWAEYRSEPSLALRNFLMEKFPPARAVQRRADLLPSARRGGHRGPDVSAGLFGLMDAIDAYDSRQGVKFETYCAPRIRGAILDELRSMDWVPRLVRHRTARKVEQARQKLEMESGRRRPPRTEIAAKRASGSRPRVRQVQARRPRPSVGQHHPQGLPVRRWREDVREIDVIRDETQVNPLRRAPAQRPQGPDDQGPQPAERLIVILYYYEA
jgi:RNA polymerase sigma factor for flagellar operon FliA